jgi:hypothetical protein
MQLTKHAKNLTLIEEHAFILNTFLTLVASPMNQEVSLLWNRL